VPWLFDEEAVDVLRHFTQLKCHLMPYLFAAALIAHQSGIPMMRAMMLAFPDDPACDYLDRQYMLGGSLLVAPVFTAVGTVDYYLPDGRWTHFFTNQTIEGGRWQREQHHYLSLPLMVRPNSLIPVGTVNDRPDYDYADGVTFHLFELADGATCTAQVPTLQGGVAMSVEVSRRGSAVRIQAEGASKPWHVLPRGIHAVTAIENGTVEAQDLGMLIVPDSGVVEVVVRV
jgi:alpha-D-xyloside xylohydrolase